MNTNASVDLINASDQPQPVKGLCVRIVVGMNDNDRNVFKILPCQSTAPHWTSHLGEYVTLQGAIGFCRHNGFKIDNAEEVLLKMYY